MVVTLSDFAIPFGMYLIKKPGEDDLCVGPSDFKADPPYEITVIDRSGKNEKVLGRVENKDEVPEVAYGFAKELAVRLGGDSGFLDLTSRAERTS